MALRAVPDHPKFARLKSILKQPKGAVLGWLETMWHFTGRFTPQGNIGKYPDAAIESWLEWDGEPGILIAAFIESGWIDRDPVHRLMVHDWNKHADKATKNALERGKLGFLVPSPVQTEYVHRTDSVRTHSSPDDPQVVENSSKVSVRTPYGLPVPVPEPVPEPEPGAVGTFPTTEQAACGNVGNSGCGQNSGNSASQIPENSRRTPVLSPEEYRAQHQPMNEAAFSKLLDSKDLNQFQNEKPKPSKPTPNVPDYLLSSEERAQPRNGSSKPREVIAIPVHPATELETMQWRLAQIPDYSPEWEHLSAEIAKKKASIE